MKNVLERKGVLTGKEVLDEFEAFGTSHDDGKEKN
jgi:hypothetical protein